jgi:hypothetical protein
MEKFKLTEDKDVVKKVVTTETLINIKELENEIIKLEEQINSIFYKTRPDQETLMLYNEHQDLMFDKTGLQKTLKQKQDLLKELKEVK